MQTVYYTTEHFIRHKGNVVDLEAYRRGMAEAAGGGFRPVPVREEETVPASRPEEKRSFRRKLSDWLEMTATLTVAAVAITICLQFVL